MLANHVFWRLILFNTHSLLLLQPSVLWLSIVSYNNDAKPPPKWILGEFDVSRIGPRLGGLPHLERLHSKIWPRVRRLPGLADRATRLGGSPHLSCKRDQIKMRDCMDRRVTPPKRVTSPTWSPPPPCKQALKLPIIYDTLWSVRNRIFSVQIELLLLIASETFFDSSVVPSFLVRKAWWTNRATVAR